MQCLGRRVVRDEEQERTLKRLERAILDIGHAKRVLIRLGLGDEHDTPTGSSSAMAG